MSRVAKKLKNIISKKNITRRKVFIYISILFFVIICTVLIDRYYVRRHQEQTDHLQPLKITNLEYCNGEKLDISVPQGSEFMPLVIYIHGGGWRYGSKVGGAAPYFYKLVNRGIAVASINYRLTDRVRYPAQLEDVKCAVQFLSEKSEFLHFDKNKIILAGQSSGGNLALISALSNKTGEYNENNIIKGVIALSAHYDLTADSFSKTSQHNISHYVDDSKRAEASPMNHLDITDPPILIFHGTKDETVNYSQAENFVKLAKITGVNVQFIPVRNADHNLSVLFSRDKPGADERLDIIEKFIKTLNN